MDKSEAPKRMGRPPGALSKLSREARERAQQSGELPHEILLSIARGNPQPVRTVTFDKETGEIDVKVTGYEVPDLERRADSAKAAAPYYAPKISTVEVITGVSEDELDNIIALAAAEAGLGNGFDGEGEESEAAPAPSAPARKRVRLREAT